MRWLATIALALALAVLAAAWLLRPRDAGLAGPQEVTAAEPGAAPELRSPLESERETPPEPVAVEPPAEEVVEEDLPPEELEEDWFPDPVQLGPAALDLRLVDARTGEPVASFVQLWRIDAPGNDAWTDGDQLQQHTHVPVEGFYFTRLPEGRYRLVCHAQAWDAQPPEVTVTAPRTQLDVPLEVPVSFRVRVVVRDRYGHPVPEVSFGLERTERLALSEPWRFERLPRTGEMFWSDEGFPDLSSGGASAAPQPDDGFDLGLYGGATRGMPEVSILLLETPEGARVRVRVPAQADGDVHLVAVALPLDEVAARVRFPGGAPAQAEVEVYGEAVGRAGGGWEQAPVQIRVRLQGYVPVSLLWTAAAGELPWIELEPER